MTRSNGQCLPAVFMLLLLLIASSTTAFVQDGMSKQQGAAIKNKPSLEDLKRDWTERSVAYYSKVARRKYYNDNKNNDSEDLARKHYFALRKVKDGSFEHAEHLYKRIIREILSEDEHLEENGRRRCDHSKLAVTTLLLALHLQRTNRVKDTRSVFLIFFRLVVGEEEPVERCACSAKVLGAFALFEMKQGNRKKAADLARWAVKFDEDQMKPILRWKQFREALSLQDGQQ